MKLTRIIHPVGQGAFYTETLYNDNTESFNMVYDCGTLTSYKIKKTKKNIIESRVDCYLDNLKTEQKKEQPEIDAIFISHLHEDHINGIDYLMKNAEVKYLFLPQLIDESIIEAYLYNYISTGKTDNVGNNLLSLLITNTEIYSYKDKNFKTQIKYVPIIEKNNSISNNKNFIVAVNYSNKNKKFIINIENSIHNNLNKFLYIPYNLNIQNMSSIFINKFIEKLQELYDKDKNFKNNLQKIGINKENLRDIFINLNLKKFNLLKIIVENIGIKKCKEIYINLLGEDQHSYSMPLFSGIQNTPINVSLINKKCCCLKNFCYRKNCYINNPNCLYMGDFKSIEYFDDLKNFYTNLNLWNTIKTIQVPHHCSRKNYHSDLYSNIYSCFISVGIKNKY